MFWKKVDKTKKAGLAFTLFGSQSLVAVDEEPVHVCSCGSASDLFLVCVKSGTINLYGTSNDAQSSPRLLYAITPINPTVLALACCPPPHFAVVTVEPENPQSAINVVRIYRPPPNTPELLPYLHSRSGESANSAPNRNTTAMYELPMHASVTAIAACAATGRLAVVTQGDVTIWAPEAGPPGHTPIYDKIMHIYVPGVRNISIYRNCLAYSNEFRVRVLEFAIVKSKTAKMEQTEKNTFSNGMVSDISGAESGILRLQSGPTALQDSDYFLSICSGQSSTAIPVANFGPKQVKRERSSQTDIVRYGPTSEVGISVKLDPQYVMRSVQLLVYARYAEPGGPINALELAPEYLYLSPPGGSPYALREVGLRCFASTTTEGHLYNVSQPGELASYKYHDAVLHCCVGDELLYAMSGDGVEAFPLRTSMNAAEYTTLPSPCSLGFKTFLGPKALVVAGQRLVLLTKLYDPSVPEPPPITPLTPPQPASLSSGAGKRRVDKRGRPIPDVSWNTYVLTPYDAEALHDDMVAQAKAASTKSAYYSLILEDHFLLQAEIVSLKKAIAARYGGGGGEEGGEDGKTPGEEEAAELKRRKARLAQSSGYLGDYLFEAKAYREAAQCFSVSDKQIAEVVHLFTASAKTPRPELLEYLDRVLFDPTISLDSGEDGSHFADAVLRYYAEFAPHRLSTIVLNSHLTGYSHEGALVLLRLVPKLLFISEKVRKSLLDTQKIPQASDSAEIGENREEDDSRMTFIDPQDFLPKDLIAQAVLCHSLGRRKTALKILSGMRPEHIVDLCVANPSLLDLSEQNSLAKPLREVAPYAVLEALETLTPADSFTLPAALDADTSAAGDDVNNDVRTLLAMLYFESKLVPLAPQKPSACARSAPVRDAPSECAEALALLYLEKIFAHKGSSEDAQIPLESETTIRKRLECNEDECFARALVRHQKAFVSCRPTWLDTVPPFSFIQGSECAEFSKVDPSDEMRLAAYFDYTHFYTKKLEGLICSGLLCEPTKLVDAIRAAVATHDNDARRTFDILLALVLPVLSSSEKEPRNITFPRFVELEPAAALDFGMFFCTGPEDWALVMEAVLKRVGDVGAADYEEVLETYRNLLDYASSFFVPEVFIGMLPKTGSIGFFLEYIEKSCQQQVAGGMRRKIMNLLTEKEIN